MPENQPREVAASPRALEMNSGRVSSIALSTTAKGYVTWDVKVYFDANKAEDREHALSEIQLIDERLRLAFAGKVPSV